MKRLGARTKGAGRDSGGPGGASSERQADLERFDDGGTGIVDADHAEQAAEEYDEAVEHNGAPLERVALQLQMEVARPYERQHCAGEAADEAHQYGEVRYGYGHEHGAQYDDHAERQAPHLELAVQVPDVGVRRGRRPHEERLLQYVARRVIRQRVRQQHFDHQEHVDQTLERGRVQVVGNHL